MVSKHKICGDSRGPDPLYGGCSGEDTPTNQEIADAEYEAVKPLLPQLPSITFSYPYGNGFDPAWIESLIHLLLHEVSKPKETRILGSILKAGSCYVDNNRDRLALDFNNDTKDDWLLMIDPDIQFSHTILETLAEHIKNFPEARVIAGRVDLLNGLPVFYKRDQAKNIMIHQPFPFEGLKKFDLVGAGILCIHREAILGIMKKEGHSHIFNKIITSDLMCIGDDFSFCLRAQRAGFYIYGAWDVYGKHWKPQPCYPRYLDMDGLTVSGVK